MNTWMCSTCAHSRGVDQKPFVLAGIQQMCNNCNSFEGVAKYSYWNGKYEIYIPQMGEKIDDESSPAPF